VYVPDSFLESFLYDQRHRSHFIAFILHGMWRVVLS